MRGHHRPAQTVLALVALLLGALLLVAGCTTTVTGVAAPVSGTAPSSAAPPGRSSAEAVAWTDAVCGALLPLTTALSAPPNVDPTNPEALTGALGDYFGDGVTALDTALAGLAATEPSPVDGGDEIITALSGTLTTFRASFSDAQAKLDAIDPADPSELVSVLPAALAPLEDLTDLTDPTTALRENPELNRAAEQAPNCRALPG